MSGIEKKPDFEMFRGTLIKLERLISVCTSHWTHHVTYTNQPSLHHAMQTTYGDAMIHTLKLLRDMNINTSESNAMEELKRLATISKKLRNKRGLEMHCDKNNANLNVRSLLNKLIDSKKAFLKDGAFSHLVKEGGVEPMTALERFLEVQMKDGQIDMEELLISRVKEAIYTREAKPLTKSVTASSRKVADPVHTSQKQENPNRDLPGECKKPKTTATSASIPSSSLENQTEIQMQWLLNRNKVHEEWILKQIEAQTKLEVDSRLKDVNKVYKRLTQDQKKVNMEWLQHQNSAHMGWILDQNKINMKWFQDSVEDHTKEGDVDSSKDDGGELTPTSTITSG